MSPKLCLCLGIAVSFSTICLAAEVEVEAAKLKMRGNEPSWQIELSDKAIVFRSLEGKTFTIEPVPQPIRESGIDTYSATVDDRQFTLAVADKLCTDTMTAMPYPKTATVVVGDRKFAGCAGEPASLLHGNWLVKRIAENAVVVGSEPFLAFGPDGSIHGNGSCNRVLGGFVLTGEGLTISETGASMMMCDQPLMDQERKFLDTLEAVRRFEVASTGQLRLLGKDGQALLDLEKSP